MYNIRSYEDEFSIREKQKRALINTLLTLNPQNGDRSGGLYGRRGGYSSALSGSGNGIGSGSEDEPWKVVVFDKRGGDIMALLFRVGDLRKQGVTLTLRLDDDARQAIPDAPAIYFVSPTQRCVDLIAKDLERGLYESAYIHSVSAFPRPLLESLATKAVQYNAASKIKRVYDQYSSFISLENTLFVTGTPSLSSPEEGSGDSSSSPITYALMNDSGMSDEAAMMLVESIAKSLFSVVLTLGTIPIIRAPRNTAAEQVAVRLHEMLQAHIAREGAAPVTPAASLHRPLLAVLDRNIDLSVMFAHPWTYRALVHELLGLDLNRTTVDTTTTTTSGSSGDGSGGSSDKSKGSKYDLDTQTDKFWKRFCGAPFPTVAVELDNEVKAYKDMYTELTKLSASHGISNPDAMSEADLEEHGLSRFVDKLPEIRATKRFIDVHTTIAPELLKKIKARNIDSFNELEDSLLMSKDDPSPSRTKEVADIVCNEAMGTVADRLRLYLVWLLSFSSPAPPHQETTAQMEEALTAQGAAMGVVAYVKQAWMFLHNAHAERRSTSPTPRSSTSSLISSAFERMYSGVKAFLPKNEKYYVTSVVEALMELKAPQMGIEDAYIYLDPKLSTKQIGPGAVPPPRKATPFRDAIVFMIGGGNYVEHQNLMDYARGPDQANQGDQGSQQQQQQQQQQQGSQQQQQQLSGFGARNTKRIIYGSTEILHPTEFLEQLAKLVK